MAGSLRWAAVAVAVLMLASGGLAEASLSPFQVISGEVAVSTDGLGTMTGTGTISANAPVGATVVGAYLYTATFFNNAATPAVNLNGTPVTFVQTGGGISFLNSFRADVTSIVKPIIDAGPGGLYNFTVTEVTNGLINGDALVVIYQKTGLPDATVAVLDGFSAMGGDSHSVIFAEPLNPAAPGFFAEMRLGISHSCCGQASNVTVNGTLATTNAGNNDDGSAVADGALLTMGGDDDPFSALLPPYASDHERYNLVPFITAGDTQIDINTNNPSFDDDIFLSVFHVVGLAGIDEPPPPPCDNPPCVPSVPAPASLILLGAGLVAAALVWRRRASR